MKASYLLIFFMLLLILVTNIEPYENIYQKNDVLSDQPDNKQFYACEEAASRSASWIDSRFKDNDYPFEKYPNSNYRIKSNSVSKPLKGTYSSFIDIHKIRTYDHFYHSPICEDIYQFKSDIGSQFRLIPGAFPEEDISLILEEEREKDEIGLNNPFYLYGDPYNIQNKIEYEQEVKDLFLKVKSERPLHHEDASHLDGFESAYSP